jgi:hypothetical protein
MARGSSGEAIGLLVMAGALVYLAYYLSGKRVGTTVVPGSSPFLNTLSVNSGGGLTLVRGPVPTVVDDHSGAQLSWPPNTDQGYQALTDPLL